MKNPIQYVFGLTALTLVSALGLWLWRMMPPTPQPAAGVPALTALEVIMIPLEGETAVDREIRDTQARITRGEERNSLLERLGWAFVAKARLTSDPGYYKLAEKAAQLLKEASANAPAARLLQAHIYHAEHRFAEAEKIARDLIAQREFVFDYALLGDVLMEQGKMTEAVGAYQKMVDLKPCLQTYSRVAHMRWLKGDLAGAMEIMRLAVASGSPREPEATAWACSRLALYQLQAGALPEAEGSAALALQFAPKYAPALLAQGRILLAQEKFDDALAPLRAAAEINPLPDYLWTLADAAQAAGETEEANRVTAELARSGASADPRTFAVYLSSERENPAQALRLATAELEERQDIFTFDAVAWAQLANGRISEAQENMHRALAEGTQDARLFYHAGAIAAAAGDEAGALEFLNKARAIEQVLLPSERQRLGRAVIALLQAAPQFSAK